MTQTLPTNAAKKDHSYGSRLKFVFIRLTVFPVGCACVGFDSWNKTVKKVLSNCCYSTDENAHSAGINFRCKFRVFMLIKFTWFVHLYTDCTKLNISEKKAFFPDFIQNSTNWDIIIFIARWQKHLRVRSIDLIPE